MQVPSGMWTPRSNVISCVRDAHAADLSAAVWTARLKATCSAQSYLLSSINGDLFKLSQGGAMGKHFYGYL